MRQESVFRWTLDILGLGMFTTLFVFAPRMIDRKRMTRGLRGGDLRRKP